MKLNSTVGFVFLAVLLISVTAIINAAQTGKIVGQIIDAETGAPVVGASVIVVGTKLGAVTDSDGRFVILQVEPGTYSIKITHLDYDLVTIVDIIVKGGVSTEVSQKLTRKVTDLGIEIVVKDASDILALRQVSNEITVSKEVVRTQPAMTLNPCMGTPMAGYVSGPGGVPLSHGGTTTVNNAAFDAMFFENYGVNPFVDTEDDHLSTFAIDVDDASFVMMRSYLDAGSLPPDEAVRTEEFVNHFDYNYKAPNEETFRLFFEGAPSRFGQNCQMLKIGIKGLEIAPENRKSANLVFVIDVSGSMDWGNRLGLVKQALRLLVDELRPDDRVGIVVYGSRGQVILEPTSIENKSRIVSAIESLHTNGATNAEEGIRLGYEMADRQFEKGKINRVILCSDGVANVGRTGPEQILEQIKQYADKGITLSSVGFGMGNMNDILMEKLGDKGNGHYAYVDNLNEARKIFVDNLTGNLQVIARDVKIQVDFNPEVVRSYRLLGYENRDIEDDKFRDDKEDGGEIGAGHEVTALYEIKFKEESSSPIVGTIFVRYKDPDDMEEVTEINSNITVDTFRPSFENCSHEFKLAACAAEFAEILRKSYWAKGSDLVDVRKLAKELVYEKESPELIELLGLISKAEQFEEQLAEK